MYCFSNDKAISSDRSYRKTSDFCKMKVVCAAKNCKYSSGSEDTSHVIFINFPNDDTSKIWAHYCGRPDLLTKSNRELHLNYYVCSRHIADHCYINKTEPVIIAQHATPLLRNSHYIENSLTNMFTHNEQTDAVDNAGLTYCNVNVETSHYQGITFSNLCRICGESSADGIQIFAAKGIELRLKDKIALHMPISVDINDVISQKICIDCYDKLEIAHSLVITCLRTDMRLKRFLNIDVDLEYDNKYTSLIEECSLEVNKEMCMAETTKNESIQFSSDVESLVNAHQLDTELKDLKNVVLSKTSFEDITKSEIPQVTTLIETYKQPDKETDNNTDVHRQNGINCSTNKNFFKDTETICHKLIPNIQQVAPNKNLFEEHIIHNCKGVSEKCNQTTNVSCNSVAKVDNVRNNLQEQLFTDINKKCGHCNFICSTKKELFNHIAVCHGGELLFKCFICNKTYEKWSSLDVHEATHRIDKPYLCDLCGKSFKHSNNLRGHKRTHLDESKKKRHICMICNSAFRSRFHLREHMNQHDGKKPYSCEQCDKAFYKRIQLRQHTLSHGSSIHMCPICGATFNRRGNMNTHFKRHGNEVRTYTCSVCEDKCKSMSALKIHRKKHTQDDIVESIKKKYTHKKIWQCKTCNQTFSKHPVLVNHEKIHTGNRIMVEWNDCGKKLASKSSLLYHIKSMHSIERPHMCQYCSETFGSKDTRLIHEGVHTGE